MHIVCPHCTTSYAIDLATLGASGRTVRCSRCKEVWLARPEEAIAMAAPVAAAAKNDADPRVRAIACHALGTFGDTSALSMLQSLSTQDPDPFVR